MEGQMLTRLPVCLRTIPLHRQRMKSSTNMRPIMLLWVLPVSLPFLAVLEELAPRLQDFSALWHFWNLDSMMLFVHMLAWPCFPLLIALSFSLGFFRQESEGFRLLWPRLLSCVLLELLLILHQPPSLIQNVLPIALDLLI